MKKLFVLVLLLVMSSSVWALEQCYVGAGIGRSHVGMSVKDRLEDFSQAEVTVSVAENRSSTTRDLFVGCLVNEEVGSLYVEAGALEGLLYEVEVQASSNVPGLDGRASLNGLGEASGLYVSALWEGQVTRYGHVFGRVGVLDAEARGCALLDGDGEYSLCTERSDLAAMLGLGWRHELADRWSVRLEYQWLGHPDIQRFLVALQLQITN